MTNKRTQARRIHRAALISALITLYAVCGTAVEISKHHTFTGIQIAVVFLLPPLIMWLFRKPFYGFLHRILHWRHLDKKVITFLKERQKRAQSKKAERLEKRRLRQIAREEYRILKIHSQYRIAAIRPTNIVGIFHIVFTTEINREVPPRIYANNKLIECQPIDILGRRTISCDLIQSKIVDSTERNIYFTCSLSGKSIKNPYCVVYDKTAERRVEANVEWKDGKIISAHIDGQKMPNAKPGIRYPFKIISNQTVAAHVKGTFVPSKNRIVFSVEDIPSEKLDVNNPSLSLAYADE